MSISVQVPLPDPFIPQKSRLSQIAVLPDPDYVLGAVKTRPDRYGQYLWTAKKKELLFGLFFDRITQ
jgi:hypothetical protein